MHAATTKIPHLLHEKSYLTPESDAWFYLQCMIFYNGYDGSGRKNPKNIYTRTTRKKSPVWFPSHPPSIKLEADCFPGRKYRKQAGPTLRGAGILLYRDKRNKGSGSAWVDRRGYYDFLHMNVRDLQKSGLGYRLGYKNNGGGEDLECSRLNDEDNDSQHTAN